MADTNSAIYDIGQTIGHPVQPLRHIADLLSRLVMTPNAGMRSGGADVARGFMEAPPMPTQPNNLQQLLQDVPGGMNLAQPDRLQPAVTPDQQVSSAPVEQEESQPATKSSGMQKMFELDAKIAGSGMEPYWQKAKRAEFAPRLLADYKDELDPLAVGMWVQGGSDAFEELAKQQTQRDVAGVRVEGRTKPLTLQDNMDLIQKKSDADAQRARQKSLEDIYAKGVMPKFGKWFDTPEKFTSAFKKQFPDFVTPGTTPQPAQSGGVPIGTVDGGYRFKGGNPNDKNNWTKI